MLFRLDRLGRSLLCNLVAIILICLSTLLVTSNFAKAGLDDCLGAVFSAADPNDLALAANFVADHGECLPNFVPPTLVPYLAVSGTLDGLNQSGALNKAGLGFGNRDYNACTAQFDIGKQGIAKLMPVIGPVCKNLGLSCSSLANGVGNASNAQLQSEIPFLGLLPCSCAVATSGLGAEKLKDIVNKTQSCGVALQDVGKVLGDGAKGAYAIGKSAVQTGENIVQAGVCAVESLFGGCDSSDPPPPPPTGISEANNWCAPHGGLKEALSKTNQPNDYSVRCNDESACVIRPGKTPACSTGAQIAAHKELLKQQQDALRQKNIGWGNVQKGVWGSLSSAKCSDDKCRFGVKLLTTAYILEAVKKANEGILPSEAAFIAEIPALKKPFLKEVEAQVNQSIIRDPHALAKDVLSAYGCSAWHNHANQSLCPNKAAYEACKNFVDKNQWELCYLAGDENSKYENKAASDPNGNLATRLALDDCKLLLGKPGQYLCGQAKGYEICMAAKAKGLTKKCLLAGQPNGTPPTGSNQVPPPIVSGDPYCSQVKQQIGNATPQIKGQMLGVIVKVTAADPYLAPPYANTPTGTAYRSCQEAELKWADHLFTLQACNIAEADKPKVLTEVWPKAQLAAIKELSKLIQSKCANIIRVEVLHPALHLAPFKSEKRQPSPAAQ